jgi:hypothetical protein
MFSGFYKITTFLHYTCAAFACIQTTSCPTQNPETPADALYTTPLNFLYTIDKSTVFDLSPVVSSDLELVLDVETQKRLMK